MKITVRGRQVLTPSGLKPASLWIKDGRIEKIGSWEEAAGADVLDAGDLAVLPGLVDTHVHVNEPGRTQWEGFESATNAAAAAGVTTIIDMPLNSQPVTTTLEALKIKRKAAQGLCRVDTGFWGGVVPENEKELAPMAAAGCFGFKCFLIDSGIPDFPAVGEPELLKAMRILAGLGLPLLVHAELCCSRPEPLGEPKSYDRYLASRPRLWENEAIELAARLSHQTGCRTHIVHLSSCEALPTIARMKKMGAPLTVETCPHYLTFDSAEIGEGRTEFKCAPPIREAANREALWAALQENLIDFIVSDHSPCSPELKKTEAGDFASAWGGIASLQLGLSAVWTQARSRKIPLERVARWMSAGPAGFAGLANKGSLAPGSDADFIFFDSQARWTVAAPDILHKHKVTPYLGRELTGRVQATFLRGEKIYENGKLPGPARGRLLERSLKDELHRTH